MYINVEYPEEGLLGGPLCPCLDSVIVATSASLPALELAAWPLVQRYETVALAIVSEIYNNNNQALCMLYGSAFSDGWGGGEHFGPLLGSEFRASACWDCLVCSGGGICGRLSTCVHCLAKLM